MFPVKTNRTYHQLKQKITNENKLEKEKKEIEEKINKIFELIEKICGENEILKKRYCYYRNSYKITLNDEKITKELFEEQIGKENIFLIEIIEEKSKDKLHINIEINSSPQLDIVCFSDQIYTDLIDKIISFGYSIEIAKKVLKVLLIDRKNVNEIKNYLFATNFESRVKEISQQLDKFNYWID